MTARRVAPLVPSLAALALLNGCATFGGNVKGSFSCQAPAGVCAPSSTIDDRALAMISGEAGDMAIPAGPYEPPAAQPRRGAIAAARPAQPAAGVSRSSERMLRIVFQPYIDDYGRLHEASAVRTVVRGEWQAAEAALPVSPALRPGEPAVSLAEAVERGDPPVALAAVDPDLPDPAAVAAARARRPDPVEAIKTDVAARLAARPRRRVIAGASPAPVARQTVVPQPRSSVPVAPAAAAAPARPPALSAEAAAARVRGDPRWKSAATAAPDAARTAASAAAGTPVMRATSFPGVTNEEN
ncbi:conjugal transfer protein [Sphingomonas sp. MA1305]|uniref:conjugal transfer protein n=1 Tax=Sphingomonas sp. MA1305 TaxID=2479204 RepID=UPI002FCD15E3